MVARQTNDRAEDEELSQRLLARDEAALRVVIGRYSASVYGLARRVITDPALAEEVAQDAFVALWRRPGAYDPARGSLNTFLCGIARNKAIDLIRRQESYKAKDALMTQEGSTSGSSAESEQLEQQHDVRQALGALPHPQREVIVLAYFGGRTYREAAVELGLPEGTVKTRMRAGLTRLRELLSKEGVA